MGELRTVKKSRNRRLYDLAESRYVTVADLCARVVDGGELRVIDAVTEEDITCSVLFRMIVAQEERVGPSMSVGFLMQAIRSRTSTECPMAATFLEQSLNLFKTLQADQKKLGSEVDKNSPPTALGLAEANYQRWCSVLSRIYKTVAASQSGDLAADVVDTSAPDSLRRPDRRLRKSSRQLGLDRTDTADAV
jgi:polyhydroxyalkanoate synthesis repressor PhaR